jgi:hypothetical protein
MKQFVIQFTGPAAVLRVTVSAPSEVPIELIKLVAMNTLLAHKAQLLGKPEPAEQEAVIAGSARPIWGLN